MFGRMRRWAVSNGRVHVGSGPRVRGLRSDPQLCDRDVHDQQRSSLYVLQRQLLPEWRQLLSVLGRVPRRPARERGVHGDDGSGLHELHGHRELHE
jgi:hypothetical protein